MLVDRVFRLTATSANAVVFAYILFTKLQSGTLWAWVTPHVAVQAIECVVLGAVFFYVHLKLILDQHPLPSQPRTREPAEAPVVLDSVIAEIRNIAMTGPVREDIEERLRTAERLLGKDRLIDALWRQHQICVDNEKFYEEIAWKVGSIFVPVGLGLGTLFLQKGGEPSPVPIVAGFLLFATWVLLFRRFRTSLRLYRECAQVIEQLMGMFAVSYVYSFSFHKYGPVIRVWPFLVALLGAYFNYAVAMIF